MRTRGSAKKEPVHDVDFESWISGLVDGEPSVRRLRQRIGSAGSAECQTCLASSTGGLHHADHADDPEPADQDQLTV